MESDLAGEYKRRRLENGLRIIGVENRGLHYFVCDVHVHAGPRFEESGQLGLSHVLEHMLMQGSEGFPTSRSLAVAVEDMGGVLDASTHPECLRISIGVHRKYWRRALEIVSDVVRRPLFDERELEQEKKVIRQEIAEYRDERGRNISASELSHCLLFKERLEEGGTRGTVELLDSLDRAAVMTHYQRFFVPQNVVICLAGSFEFQEVMEKVREAFDEWRRGDGLPELVDSTGTDRRARSFFRNTERLPLVHATLCYHAYAFGDERLHAAKALSSTLGEGLSSRLFSRVREELGLVYHVESYTETYSDTGSLEIRFDVDTTNLIDAAEATLDVVRVLAHGGVSAEELERYKESVRCGMDIMCDRPSLLADWYAGQELLLSPDHLMTPHEYVGRQESLSIKQVQVAIEDVLQPSAGNLTVVGPIGEAGKDRLREVFPAEEADIV